MTSPLNLPARGRCQAVYLIYRVCTALCFCYTGAWTYSLRLAIHEDPLSRSYRVILLSSLTMRLSTPYYVLPDHVCRFAVRVPHGLSLADFLGSMITHTVRFLRRGLRTVKFSSDGGFACHPQHLHSSTGTSVAPRWFHCSVSTSPHAAVTEY